MGDVPPSCTIYVNNLNEKIKKDGARDNPKSRTSIDPPRRMFFFQPQSLRHALTRSIHHDLPSRVIPRRLASDNLRPPCCTSPFPSFIAAELKKSLQAIFSQFGKIVDLVAAKTYKLRGQAWVVFADVASAGSAMRTMQGFPFYDKPMKLAYAKTKSDATAKAEESFDPAARDPTVRQKRKLESQKEERASQATRAEEEEPGSGPAPTIRTDPSAPPNEILFVQGLPGECSIEGTETKSPLPASNSPLSLRSRQNCRKGRKTFVSLPAPAALRQRSLRGNNQCYVFYSLFRRRRPVRFNLQIPIKLSDLKG